MAHSPLPPYMVANGGFGDFGLLLASGDLGAMKGVVARSEKWLADPVNADHPSVEEERQRVKDLKAEIEDLERIPATVN